MVVVIYITKAINTKPLHGIFTAVGTAVVYVLVSNSRVVYTIFYIRGEGFMVKLAESLIRPRWSAIVTRVPWFELAEIFIRL